MNCSSLDSIVIPNRMTRIEIGTFKGCTALSSIEIPENITQIGNYAFYDCIGLKKINSRAVEPPTISQETFYNVDRNIPLYVPSENVALYQSAAYWSEFNNITEYQSGVVGINTNNPISITNNNGTLNIDGCVPNAVVNIYTPNGSLLHCLKESHATGLVLPRGIYLVQVGCTIEKVVF